MKTIRKKVVLLCVSAGVGFVFILYLFIQGENTIMLNTEIAFLFTMLLDVVLTLFLIKTFCRFKTAKLIVENQILHIQSAKTETFNNEGGKKGSVESTEAFVSCFGLLLNAKVIKFNLDHINLINVEIGEQHIELTYGTHKKIEKTRILRDKLNANELQRINAKFRYETGIAPVVIGKESEVFK